MFFDSEIATKFSLGKTKSRYNILYTIAPELKIIQILLYDVKFSPFFFVSFNKILNADLQMCQIDVALHFWNDKTGLAETKYFDPQFLRRLAAQNLLDSLCESMGELEKNKLLQLAVESPTRLVSVIYRLWFKFSASFECTVVLPCI